MKKTETIFDVISQRKSIRAFLLKDVTQETIKKIFEQASRAPSGANIQPWNVIILQGQALKAITTKLHTLSLTGVKPMREYHYYPQKWREPYISRRRKVGWDLYNSLGIQKTDREKIKYQQAKNFLFFGAPIGIIFTMDRDMEIGSWLDLGMFIQTVALAAKGFGLDTCIQAAFSEYHEHISVDLKIPSHRQIICGMALGYAKQNAPENNFSTERVTIEEFVEFIDFLP
ncbi:nitroreductase [Bartonella tamiae]|uniref:Nitroreductase domain-containing protein n=1 Tax=Bartonella tamiae Th239 TaxID=1094558 RepID=J0QRZ6_9HYPH|nr:nitroreductase [Bartonella tamiae]EJF88616.1 hypothetical protein ME5_01167 [Bartonella tamiae Th239]EJF95134.1 hypothetical protein MEG_00715 [Bartonella tamiae Th307]